ncbi:MAG: hypothetical protein HQL48_06245, partial [Gammaproteobacteria bacterium]|nr:hypothetical protein [Gammaproteobacteria bacterium]
MRKILTLILSLTVILLLSACEDTAGTDINNVAFDDTGALGGSDGVSVSSVTLNSDNTAIRAGDSIKFTGAVAGSTEDYYYRYQTVAVKVTDLNGTV